MNRDHIHEMRENYDKGTLERSDLLAHPINQFRIWFDAAVASGIKEANVMTLSTVDENGIPSGRTVLMKDLTQDGIIFYTNLESDKAQHIYKNKNVSLTFLWLEMERQVRVNGHAIEVDKDTATTYFQSRPKASQIGAWASAQSKIIQDRVQIESKVEQLQNQYRDTDFLPKPPFWGGFLIKPSQVEFWQGRRSRLHDRFRYDQKNGKESWDIVRLSP
ncbi:MAG: pyridoxamine 5'-phosphate oxidase [Saprospiraceae bacterium]|nr:pyridoxamine 5'-phosphate oxidase [Saprospiraceae bacterium]